jgi:hypothetical protein
MTSAGSDDVSRSGAETISRRYLALADAWIARAVGDAATSWFRQTIEAIAKQPDGDAFVRAIGLAPRRLGKADLVLSPEDRTHAASVRPGFDPGDWSIDQVARVAFMVATDTGDDSTFATRFDAFCATAELNELIAMCRGLPVYPAAALLERRAREAVRSGMKPVFEAVAHRNPYPVEVFAEDAWNQMVVKAFFIGSSLWPIQGLDQRGNPRLARMLVDLALERWAAGRPVSGEVWRCVAPHADAEGIAALLRAFETGGEKERFAVALAQMSPGNAASSRDVGAAFAARGLTRQIKDLQSQLAETKIGWRELA